MWRSSCKFLHNYQQETIMETLIDLEQDVIRTISPNEGMNRDDRSFPEQYWIAGRSALAAIRAGLDSAQKLTSEISRVLDLPCGHGRVLRYLHAAFPDAKLTACDLLSDGVEFCSKVFGATPVYSHEDLSKIPLEESGYDLIWVGSLFTHLDSARWTSLLAKLTSALSDGGLLVFTTHGRYVYRQLSGLEDASDYGLPYYRITKMLYGYEHSGFGYGDYPESDGYGVSLSDPHWVIPTLAAQKELQCVHFSERAWHNVQDVYACLKSQHPSVKESATPLRQYVKHVVREVLEATR